MENWLWRRTPRYGFPRPARREGGNSRPLSNLSLLTFGWYLELPQRTLEGGGPGDWRSWASVGQESQGCHLAQIQHRFGPLTWLPDDLSAQDLCFSRRELSRMTNCRRKPRLGMMPRWSLTVLMASTKVKRWQIMR